MDWDEVLRISWFQYKGSWSVLIRGSSGASGKVRVVGCDDLVNFGLAFQFQLVESIWYVPTPKGGITRSTRPASRFIRVGNFYPLARLASTPTHCSTDDRCLPFRALPCPSSYALPGSVPEIQ